MFGNEERSFDKLAQDVRQAGGRMYLIGGIVRDMVFHEVHGVVVDKSSFDVDTVILGLSVPQIQHLLREYCQSAQSVITESGIIFECILDSGESMDVVMPSVLDPETDEWYVNPYMSIEHFLRKADFTMNGMAMTIEDDLSDCVVIDPWGGRHDIEDRLLSAVDLDTFDRSPVRGFRAARFATRFNLRLCRALEDKLYAMRHLTVPVEQQYREWTLVFEQCEFPGEFLYSLRNIGWLDRYPELAALDAIPQDPTWHPEGNVFVHTHFVMNAAKAIAQRERLTGDDFTSLLWAATLHDIGKPECTMRSEDDARIISPGHAQHGALVAESFLKTLRSPQRIIDSAVPLIREHMFLATLSTDGRSVRRLANRLNGVTIQQWALLIEADHSGRPPLQQELPERFQAVVALANHMDLTKKPDAILMGRHLADHIEPGKRMGRILAQAFEAQLDGAFSDLSGAMRWFQTYQGRVNA